MNPLEKIKQEYSRLKSFYAGTGFKFSFEVFVLSLLAMAFVSAFFISTLKLSAITSIICFFAIMSLAVLIPLNVRNSRIAAIDSALPDMLKHMALVLKSGGTTEAAFAEVATAGYGPLSADLKDALRELKEGKTFDDVLKEKADVSGSILFKRTASIIVDAKRAGAGVADVMLQIAEDARDLFQIKRERMSRTTIHAVFLLSAGLFIAPFIFGFTIAIVSYINQGIASALPNAPATDLCGLNNLLSLFILVQTIVTAFSLGIIREGRMFKYILYAPLMVLCSLLVFEAGKWLGTAIVGGAQIIC